MTFKVDNLISFLGWDTLASSLIEKARYCAFIPRDKENPLELHNECLLQLQFLEWCKTEPQVPQVVKDYVNQITFENQYDQYVLDLKLNDSFYTSLYYTLWSHDSSEEPRYNEKDLEECYAEFEAWYDTSVLKVLEFNKNIVYKKFSIFTGRHHTGTTFSPTTDYFSKDKFVSIVKELIGKMALQNVRWDSAKWDLEYHVVLDNTPLVIPAKIEVESSVEDVSSSSNRSVSVALYIDKKKMDAVFSLAGSIIHAL